MQQQEQVHHYTVRPLADGHFECLIEELGQKVIGDTEQAALLAGEGLVAHLLYEAALREQATVRARRARAS